MKRKLILVCSCTILVLAMACGPEGDLTTEQSTFALTETVPVYPGNATDFWILADGTDLKSYDTSNLLARRKGKGNSFTSSNTYQKLKTDSAVHWIVKNLDTGEIIAQNSTANKSVYGASVSKALVVAALLNNKNGKLDKATWQLVYKLLVNSDNNVWTTLENLAGGKSAVNAWTKSMGYVNTKGDRSGNLINALELSMFLYDVHHQRFPGAEALLKVMSACNTAGSKSLKYLPTSVYLGGKTGTYSKYYHDMRFIEYDGHRWAIVVLTEKSSNENVAVMFGGLAREYLPDFPDSSQSAAFIGRPCKDATGCSGSCLTTFPDGYVFSNGMCTESCQSSCPDKSGEPTTYCITFNATTGFFEGSQGHCFSACDKKYYPGTGCRAGYTCSKMKRNNSSSSKEVCIPQEETPATQNFVGGSCPSNNGCESGKCLTSFADGYTFTDGMCTQSCTKLCPDKSGQPETFCATFNATTGLYSGDEGHCFSRCDTKLYSGEGCRQGYVCVKVARHKDSSTKRNICVPDPGKGDISSIGEAPDDEGDLPNPETLQRAGGCAVSPANASEAGWTWLLLAAVFLAWRRRK